MTNKWWLLLIPFMAACSRSSMNVPDFCRWVNSAESGMISKKEINKLEYTAMYRPAEYIVLQDGSHNNNPAAGKAAIDEASGSQFFVFQVASADTKDVLAVNAQTKEEYHARVIYLSYNVRECFNLIEDNDTLPCRLAQFEQLYAAAPYVRFNLVFDNPASGSTNAAGKKMGDKILVYDDVVWGNGIIKFRIKANDLERIPNVMI